MKTYKLIAPLLAAIFAAGCGGNTNAAEPDVTGTSVISAVPEISDTTEDIAPVNSSSPSAHGYSELLNCLYFDRQKFDYHLSRSRISDTNGELLCGVAPHHLAAGHFIAGLYQTAAATRKKTDTVIVVAPMHYESENTLCTSRRSWNTEFGTAENDTEITEMFCSELGAARDDDMTEFDHSASSHIPYIKYFLPDAKVACLLVSPREAADIPQRLSELLAKAAEIRSCLITFSIDFSHYLQPDEAELHDAETLEAVTSCDTARIERFTNNNVDTPYCLSTFVRLSEKLGSTISAAEHGNTFTVGELPYSPMLFEDGVTSYFVFTAS